MEGIEDISTLWCDGIAEEGILGENPARVVGIESEGKSTRFEVVAREVNEGGKVGVVGVQEHNAIRDRSEFGSGSQSTERIFKARLANLVSEKNGEMVGVGNAFEGREDSSIVGCSMFANRRVEMRERVDDDEAGCRILLEPGFEGVESAAGKDRPGVLPIEVVGRRASLQLMV